MLIEIEQCATSFPDCILFWDIYYLVRIISLNILSDRHEWHIHVHIMTIKVLRQKNKSFWSVQMPIKNIYQWYCKISTPPKRNKLFTVKYIKLYIYSKHLKRWLTFIICLKISIKIDALTVVGKTNRMNRNVGRVVMEVQPLKLLHKYLSSYKQRLPSQPSFSCPTLYELIISNMNKTKM